MLAHISTFLAAPPSNDEDRLRIVTLLNAIIYSGIAIVILNLLARLVIAPDTVQFLWTNVVTLGLLLGLWLLTRRGYVRSVSVGMSAGLWVMVTLAVLNYGTGVFAPSFVYYTALLVITGLTLGGRGAAVLATVTILTSFYIVYTVAHGNLFTPAGTAPSAILWLNYSLSFAVIVFLIGLANRGILKALDRARNSERRLADQNEALRTSQAKLETQSESLTTINAIATVLHTSLDFETVVELALDAIVTYTHADSATLYFSDDRNGVIRLMADRGKVPFPNVVLVISADDQEGRLITLALKQKQVIATEDLASETRMTNSRVKQGLLESGFVSGAAIPLILHERAVGVVGLGFKTKRSLSAEQQATLLGVGNTIALAITNAQHVTRVEEEIAERRRAETAQQAAEDKYRTIVENSIEGIFQITVEGRILTANPAFANMLDYASPEMLMTEVTHMAQLYVDPQQRQAAIRRLKQDGEVRAYECELRRRDGEVIWVSFNTRAVRDAEGQVLHLEGTVEDVTYRKHAEAELRANEARFRMITSVISDYTFSAHFNAEDTLEYSLLTGAFETITGYTPEEFVARGGWRSILHPDDVALDDEGLAAVQRNEHVTLERRIIRKDGQVRYVRTFAIPIWDEKQHKLIGINGAVQDITERRLAEEALRASEERFRLITSVMSDYTFGVRINEKGEFENTFLTGAFEAITGYNAEEFIATRNWRTDLLHPDDIALDDQLVAALHQNQRGIDELRLIHKNGEIRYVRDYALPIWDEKQQKLVGIIGAVQDITERKLAEEALRASEARFRAIFEGASVGVALTDRDGYLMAVNPAYERLLGYTQGELRQLTFKDITYPDDLPQNIGLFEQFFAGEIEQYQLEKRYVHKDGRTVPVRLNAARFPGDTSAEDFLIVHIEDITEIKQAQARQIELAVAIERARVDVLKDFLSSATHDLRTPLSVMNSSLYLLRRSAQSEKQLEYVERLENQTRHINALIESLFTLARLDLAEAEFTFTPCELNGLVQATVEQQHPLARNREHALLCESGGAELWIKADAGELMQALKHLVVNACNYSPPGGRIIVKTRREHGQAVVEVIDHGIGISAEELPLIFERFYRADKARQIATGSAGLGLTIARKIVEAHQGQLAVESAVGEGSTFRICVPLTEQA